MKIVRIHMTGASFVTLELYVVALAQPLVIGFSESFVGGIKAQI